MKIYDLINDETRHKLNASKPVHRQPKRKDNYKYSRREWLEMMGTNRDAYKRVKNGRVRRK